ncbi:MAG: mannose-1-phosphate guanylyltransferase [Bacteroidetes bacterium GWE2_42_24]|nr:MAG: mannose-1-phosphate guanylyltransferase [Bacteroidetes bacterium GWE2_42_24]OFY31197.1 MAG: mannose-1-phosphate guanylyltransferase [Bacteroidetes bacterium GWF2_43_11]
MEHPKYIIDRRINDESTILQALQKMDAINRKLLLVFKADRFIGVLSIGDLQKAIISNRPFDYQIDKLLRRDFVYATIKEPQQQVLETMKKHRIECMPVLDEKGNLVDTYLWEDVFKEYQLKNIDLNLPVVIMAGGKGSRLKPLTNVIPKPLIPINNKTIIEDIMDHFVDYGCHQFYLSVNYKAELIRYYFDSLNNPEYCIDYFQEDNPLGTAGSLSLLKGKINRTFFVSNCDILIDQDYSEILKYHLENKNEITIVAALKHYPIPYGTIETGNNGRLIELTEKPELTFKINSGMYILEPQVLNEIPDNQFLHITQLIEGLVNQGRNVGVFPVSEKSWRDIGEWNEYLKNIK